MTDPNYKWFCMKQAAAIGFICWVAVMLRSPVCLLAVLFVLADYGCTEDDE